MKCKLCHSAALTPLPFDVPPEAGVWFRCRACGSDSAAHGYDPSIYGSVYLAHHLELAGGDGGQADQISSNLDWFGHHHTGDEKTFLDVGCCDGGGLRGMAARGWAVHGWDVFPPPYHGPHVTVMPFFSEWHFPRRFAAVLCREVVEHVPDPDRFLHALHAVTLPGGLVQVQTPKPGAEHHPSLYQRAHLFLASPGRLLAMLKAAMLDVIEFREWEAIQPGQAVLCRARR